MLGRRSALGIGALVVLFFAGATFAYAHRGACGGTCKRRWALGPLRT